MIAKTLPSLFTLGNLLLGVVSLILAFEGKIGSASIMVIIGMMLDALDGRVARMLNAQSEFGKELDSLSDVISFGVAPAMIMYVALLGEMGVLGVLATALFPICGALRLARFNTRPASPAYFVGLPITAAGGILATLALYYQVFPAWILLVGIVLLSFLMVSSIKYPAFKKMGMRRQGFWVMVFLFAVLFILAYQIPQLFPKIIFIPLGLYAAFGLYRAWHARFRRMRRSHSESNETP